MGPINAVVSYCPTNFFLSLHLPAPRRVEVEKGQGNRMCHQSRVALAYQHTKNAQRQEKNGRSLSNVESFTPSLLPHQIRKPLAVKHQGTCTRTFWMPSLVPINAPFNTSRPRTRSLGAYCIVAHLKHLVPKPEIFLSVASEGFGYGFPVDRLKSKQTAQLAHPTYQRGKCFSNLWFCDTWPTRLYRHLMTNNNELSKINDELKEHVSNDTTLEAYYLKLLKMRWSSSTKTVRCIHWPTFRAIAAVFCPRWPCLSKLLLESSPCL